MEIILKPCTAADIDVIHKLAMQSYQQHYLYLWINNEYAEWYMNRSFSTESLQAQMRDANAFFYLILHGHIPVGFVKLNDNKNAAGKEDAKSVELERIYIIKEASGKGVGTTVVHQLLHLLQQQHKETLWLKSMDSSPSVHFYQKMGFTKTGIERLPFEGFVDAYRHMYIMVRPVH